jgi:primosomal protein N'
MIDGIQFAEESLIYVDKRNLGNFGENDEVSILKYNPAEALSVEINISSDFILPKGDWTSNIKPSLVNRLIDLGQEVSFLIPWENNAPIIVSGYVNSTLPNPPVIIGERTQIFLEKYPPEQLNRIQQEKVRYKEARVDILEQQIQRNTIGLIKQIKHQKFPYKGQKYDFKATNPRKLFSSVLKVFEGLDFIEEQEEKVFDDKEQDYLATVVYALKKEKDLQVIDVQISASGNSGCLLLWVTGRDEKRILETLKHYDVKLSQLKEGLEQKVEVLSAQCPECGGTLPMKDIDINGIVECVYCGKISKIPKALRY